MSDKLGKITITPRYGTGTGKPLVEEEARKLSSSLTHISLNPSDLTYPLDIERLAQILCEEPDTGSERQT